MHNPDYNLQDASGFFPSERIAIIGQRIVDFWPIVIRKPPVVVATCEGGEEVEGFSPGAVIVSPERISSRRCVWTNRSIGDVAKLAKKHLDRALFESEAPISLLPYCATNEVEQYAIAKGLKVAAIRAVLKSRLDDKIYVRSRLRMLGLPVPRFITLEQDSQTYSFLIDLLGEKFILQRRAGSAGIGTHQIKSAEDFQALRESHPDELWLASSYVGDTTLNVHGLVLQNQVDASVPSVQLSGVVELTENQHGYCGNDFGAVRNLPNWVGNACQQLVTSVGWWLRDEGYIGLFGVDIAFDGNSLNILEINPRLQGSTWLLGELEERSGCTPLVVKHVLAHVQGTVAAEPRVTAASGAAQGILHLRGIKPSRVSHTLRCGTYSLVEGENLIYRRAPQWPLNLSSSEVFVFGLPRLPYSVLDPGATLARFACVETLVTATGRQLTKIGVEIVMAIKRQMIIQPLETNYPL